MFLRSLCILFVVVVLAGCSTEVDLTAPYEENTVVYALLDQNETRHYIKINRAFLGDGDAYVYAQIPDSNEYTEAQLPTGPDGQAWIHPDGDDQRFPLYDTILENHEPGIFYGPAHKLYYYDGPLGPKARLELNVKGNSISATTPIVKDFALNPNLTGTIGTVQVYNSGYVNFRVKWTAAENGKRYEVSYQFNYDEVIGTDTIPRNFVERIGQVVSTNIVGGEEMTVELGGESLFATIGARVQQNPDVTHRIFRGLDFIFAVAGPDLHTYLQLGSPFSGLVEERPIYSNVENGYGLFSSRRFKTSVRKQLSPTSIPQLVQGQYTGTLLFCVPNADPDYTCD